MQPNKDTHQLDPGCYSRWNLCTPVKDTGNLTHGKNSGMSSFTLFVRKILKLCFFLQVVWISTGIDKFQKHFSSPWLGTCESDWNWSWFLLDLKTTLLICHPKYMCEHLCFFEDFLCSYHTTIVGYQNLFIISWNMTFKTISPVK